MSKKILIITTSLRRGSNSDALAEQFAKGAAQAGHSVETLSLRDKNLQFCRGCLACQSTGKCVIRDDVAPMLEQIRTADVLVFATPIYFYEMSGQMKVLLDRTDPTPWSIPSEISTFWPPPPRARSAPWTGR